MILQLMEIAMKAETVTMELEQIQTQWKCLEDEGSSRMLMLWEHLRTSHENCWQPVSVCWWAMGNDSM